MLIVYCCLKSRGRYPVANDDILGSVANSRSIRKCDGMSLELDRLGSDTKQAIDQTNLGEHITLAHALNLSFSNHVHRLVAA